MLAFLIRILELIAILWVLRFLWKVFFGGSSPRKTFRSSGPAVIAGELKKDPNCGTYVSTEVSFKTRYGNEELHFCSRQCQQEFLKVHPEAPA